MNRSIRYDSGTDYEFSTYAYIEDSTVCFTEAHEPEHDYPGDEIAPAQNVHVSFQDAIPLCLWVLSQIDKDPLVEQSPHQLVARVRSLEAQLEHIRMVRDANAKDLADALGYVPRIHDTLLPEDPILPQVIGHAIEEIPKLKARAVGPTVLWIALNAMEGHETPEHVRKGMIKNLKEALVKLGEPVDDAAEA